MTSDYIRERPETREFRKQMLQVIARKKKATAYDITKALQEKGMQEDERRRLYHKVLHHLRMMEMQGTVKFVGTEAGSGPIPKRLYRRGKR